MRTNIVLDDVLMAQALALTGVKSKKEVIHLALNKLIESEKNKSVDHSGFVSLYINKPLKVEQFAPMNRDEIYAP